MNEKILIKKDSYLNIHTSELDGKVNINITVDPVKNKFKPGDKVRIKDGISSETHFFVEPSFTKGMNEFIGRKLTVNGYVPGYRYVNISESVYNFPEDWLEPYVEELKKGDLAIFWDNGVKHSASVRMYDGLFMRDYCDTGGVRWDNAIKFESIEQYEKLLRGEI